MSLRSTARSTSYGCDLSRSNVILTNKDEHTSAFHACPLFRLRPLPRDIEPSTEDMLRDLGRS